MATRVNLDMLSDTPKMSSADMTSSLGTRTQEEFPFLGVALSISKEREGMGLRYGFGSFA